MGDLNCCHGRIEEHVILTDGFEKNNNFDDIDDFPHDSLPSLREKINQDNIEENQENESFSLQKKEALLELNTNAYEVEIQDNIKKKENEEENKIDNKTEENNNKNILNEGQVNKKEEE